MKRTDKIIKLLLKIMPDISNEKIKEFVRKYK